MTIEQELQLSYYRQVADINADHGIYLVQDVRNQKFYVKKLLKVYNAEIYQYLQRHPVPNTPRTYLAIEDSGILTIIEEYVPGDTLEEIQEQSGSFSEDRVLEIVGQLCTILDAFHRCTPAIVNRDIKPSNIKLTPDGVVKLLDLNAAKWSNDQSSQDTMLLGTQGYAAPEQYGFGPSSVLTDIYSVGVLMNVMLTGELPNKRIANGKLGAIIRRCVELSPGGRYQSIAELQAAFDEVSGKVTAKSANTHGWKRFLPPGFRSKNPMTWLFSCFGYVLLFFLGLTLEVENGTAVEVFLNRLFFTVAMLSVVLFTGNYMSIHSKFPLTRSKNWFIRWLGIAIVDVVLFSIAVLVLMIIESFILT